MKKLVLLSTALLVLGACVEDGVSPTAVPAEFRVLSAVPAAGAGPSGTARGETGSVVVSGTFVGDCSTELSAEGRRYQDLLVVDLISRTGTRPCQGGTGTFAFEYEAVLTGVQPGLYRVEVMHNAGPFDAPTQTVRVR
jgi:hypothetical protein